MHWNACTNFFCMIVDTSASLLLLLLLLLHDRRSSSSCFCFCKIVDTPPPASASASASASSGTMIGSFALCLLLVASANSQAIVAEAKHNAKDVGGLGLSGGGGTATFDVLSYGAVGDGEADDTKASKQASMALLID
jgi:hypothetical protein